MKERKRQGRGDVWRCLLCSCRKELSIRAGCAFFTMRNGSIDHQTRMPLNEILEIMYMFFTAPLTIRQAADFSQHSPDTIMNRYHMCRVVRTMKLDRQPIFFGTSDCPIEVNESF